MTDLVAGDIVRFRRSPKRWAQLKVRGVNPDGSIDCIEIGGRGHTRALSASVLEVQRRGPRGGRHWITVGGEHAHDR